MQGCVTIAEALYGNAVESRQVHTVMKAAARARREPQVRSVSFLRSVWPSVQGSLRSMKADLETGLVGNIERRVAGEVIADMLRLAKEALQQSHLDVAAVLTAAAFEDTVRNDLSECSGPKLF